METQEKATQILDRQIAEVQEKINQTKINIADVFIKTFNVDMREIRSPKDFLPYAEDIEKMPQYLTAVKEHENVLDALTKSRTEIVTASIE